MVLAAQTLLDQTRQIGSSFADLFNGGSPPRSPAHIPTIHPENILTFTRLAPQVGLAPEFRFRINPDNLTVTRPKIQEWILTKLGFERQFWANNLVQFDYSGSTGAFRIDEATASRFIEVAAALLTNGSSEKVALNGAFQNGVFDIRLTQAWMKFQEFDSFFQKSGPTAIGMSFWPWNFEWIGSLDSFQFKLTVTEPFLIKYSFKYTAIPDHKSYFQTVEVFDTNKGSFPRDDIQAQQGQGIFVPRAA